MATSALKEPLPTGDVVSQEEIQRRLAAAEDAGVELPERLGALENWSRSVGYFRHLTQPNEYFRFADPELRVDVRLQVNYSRLGYTAPPPTSAVSCPLCFGNIGIPGKELLRVQESALAGVPYFFQLTPFPLCEGHFVGNCRTHEPMRIAAPALCESADFVRQCPGWLVASNSDVAWAGASVLSHHHIQIFRDLQLPVESASAISHTTRADLSSELLSWPCPVVRLVGNPGAVLEEAVGLVTRWKATDPGSATCNYLMRCVDRTLAIHLFFRHPKYRTPDALRTIKSEGVGIIEVAGEVIVPPLKEKTRAQNREYFLQHGLDTVRGIIAGNGPFDQTFNRQWYSDFCGHGSKK